KERLLGTTANVVQSYLDMLMADEWEMPLARRNNDGAIEFNDDAVVFFVASLFCRVSKYHGRQFQRPPLVFPHSETAHDILRWHVSSTLVERGRVHPEDG